MRQALRGSATRSHRQPDLIRGVQSTKMQCQAIPAPVGGWDAISPLAEMDPTRAPVLDNWFPQPGYVEVRKGYASFSTGMGSSTSVESLMVYNGLSSSKLFSVAGGTIYDSTSSGAASATTVTTLTSNRWRYVNYTTSAGTAYLWACNGVDDPKMYNGSTWATPTITGVTPSNISNVCVFKKYLFLAITGSPDAYYLPLDSIQGAATQLPLGSVMGNGGTLVAIATWTRDGGAGPDDYIAFISSNGQIAIYNGTNPASDFTLVGVYNIAPPIGFKCATKVGGDVAIITVEGVIPMSVAIQTDRAATERISLTQRINNAMNAAAQMYKSNFGWELIAYPTGTAAILNVPTAEDSTAQQFVMNTITGAWCRFTGWNANCFAFMNNTLYFGGNTGVVYKAWTGSVDGSTAIEAVGQTAYNFFNEIGLTKRFTAVQPLITTDQSVTPAIGISTDFRDNAVVGTPTASTVASALYDSAIYDTDVYSVEGRTSADWVAAPQVGKAASVHFRASSNSTSQITIQLNGANVMFEAGSFY